MAARYATRAAFRARRNVMSRKKNDRRRPRNPAGGDPSSQPAPTEDGRFGDFRARAASLLAGIFLGRFLRVLAAFVLGIAAVLLIIAWQAAPQRALDAAKYSRFTARADGKIVESWLAIQWHPGDMGELLRWHAFAKTSPCAVVEYAGDWGAPLRRAFCGNRFSFREEFPLHDITQMAPDVPFDWPRDERGLIVPEIRVSHVGMQWLTTHPPYSTFMLAKPPPTTALDALKLQVNRPVDDAIASWSRPPPAFALALDPQQPAEAMPAGYVESRRSFHPRGWLLFLVIAAPGLALWFKGMQLILGNVPPVARRMLSVVPLFTLPLWSEQFPNALRSVNKDLANVIADIVGDIDRTERLIGSDAADATLADGERLVFHVGQGPYAATFGRIRFSLPESPPASADEALAALTQTVTRQVRALGAAEQTEVFAQLTRDKINDLRGAGLVFLPAAKEALLDAKSEPAQQGAARWFLSHWVTQPIEEPHARDLALRERVRLYSELAAIPIPEISIMAGSVVERARRGK